VRIGSALDWKNARLPAIQGFADDSGSYSEPLLSDQNFMFIQSLAFKAAYLFRHGETYEVVEGDSILLRQVIRHIFERYRKAKRECHASFFIKLHFLALFIRGTYTFVTICAGL
jgi:hypothetical protein